MKVRTNDNGMKQLEKLGFKKIKTEPGFHMYELTPARDAGPAAGKIKVKEEFYWRYIYARTAKRASAQARKRTSKQAHKLDK